MKTSLVVALLFASGLAAAQNSVSQGSVGNDQKAMRTQLRAMSTQEKDELKAVKADKTKSAVDKKATIKSILLNYRAKRRAIQDQRRKSHHKNATPSAAPK